MSFKTTPTGYEKTVLSDLQGAWSNLRNAVVEHFGFPNSDTLLFHIDEAMSWESVRNLKHMEATLLTVQNIAVQAEPPEEILEWINDTRETLEEALDAIKKGEINNDD